MRKEVVDVACYNVLFDSIHREPVPLHRIATLAIDDYKFVAGDGYMRW